MGEHRLEKALLFQVRTLQAMHGAGPAGAPSSLFMPLEGAGMYLRGGA
jgi:hypothetical protein